MRNELIGIACLFLMLMANGLAANSADTAPADVRLKIPIKPVRVFRGGLISVDFRAEAWSFIDQTGKVVIPTHWVVAHNFYEGLAVVLQKDKFGYIDKTGKFALAPQWWEATDFDSGIAQVQPLQDKYRYIDKNGKDVPRPPHWSYPFHVYSGNLTIINQGEDKYGVTGVMGTVVVKPEWEEITIYDGYIFAMRMVDPSQNPHRNNNAPLPDEYPAEAIWFDCNGKMIWHSEP